MHVSLPPETDATLHAMRVDESISGHVTGTTKLAAAPPPTEKVDTIDVTATAPLSVSQTGRTFALTASYAANNSSGVIRIATTSELNAGTATNVAITPALLETRLGGFQIVDASTTDKGLVEIATNTEVITGTDSTKAITPASLRAALDDTGYTLDAGTY